MQEDLHKGSHEALPEGLHEGSLGLGAVGGLGDGFAGVFGGGGGLRGQMMAQKGILHEALQKDSHEGL